MPGQSLDTFRRQRWARCAVVALFGTASATGSQAVDLPPPPPQAVRAADAPAWEVSIRRFALIIVGLPGDEEHAGLFRQTVQDWSNSLKATAGVPEERLFIVGLQDADAVDMATGDNLPGVIQQVSERIRTDDALWVLFLGHGSYDGQHAWFHLPGPDLHDGDWADLFTRINCREQVFWFTQSASGGFVRAFSRPDRIVIAATQAAGEVNETTFPHTLNDVLSRNPAELDADNDGRVSVLEVFRATHAGVASYFEENELAATEHAQLDDNADGQGSEAHLLIEPGVQQLDPTAPGIDGALAAQTFVTSRNGAGDSADTDE